MSSYPPDVDEFDSFDVSDRPWDESRPEVRIESELARAEFSAGQIAREMAAQMAAIANVLDEASRHPEIYIRLHEEPTKQQLGVARDAAIADIAMRLAISENTVVSMAHQAQILQARAPRLWLMFREGDVSAAHARIVAATLESLPENPETDAALDAKAVEWAGLPPARFTGRMRTLRERLHPVSLTERHAEAAAGRRAWRENDRDGMAWLGIQLRAPDAEAAWQRADDIARHLASLPDESRTLDQILADVFADILTGRNDPATEPRVELGVLIPMMTLLGLSEEPATLDGYGPIDAKTARELAGHAPSFHRILTHPVTSTILDVDRRSYRPPKDLKRWLALRDRTCRFYGCGRLAKYCDIDHTTGWAEGGTTSATNLAHVSERHHTVKTDSLWKVKQGPGGTLTWTSPTGATRTTDPPPF
jgi:hypothetical protein